MKCDPQSVRRRAPGVIRADEGLTLREFLKRADLGDHTWRKIRPQIKVRRIGYKVYVLGSDWLEFLASVEPDTIKSDVGESA